MGREMPFPPELLLREPEDFPGTGREEAALREALHAWREHRAVYAFEPELAGALCEPAEKRIGFGWNLLRLPCPALYIGTGLAEVPDFFAYREGHEMCFLSVEGTRPVSLLRLSMETKSFGESIRQAAAARAESLFGTAFVDFQREAAEKLQFLMYLSAMNAEISSPEIFGDVQILRVGVRSGTRIRGLRDFRIMAEERKRGASIRHIRKGHWHTYRLGARGLPREERDVVLKWIPPEIVGSEGKVVQVVTIPVLKGEI